MKHCRELFNYRHPGPRRVWKGGPEPRLLTPDLADRADPVDPLMSSKIAPIAHKKQRF